MYDFAKEIVFKEESLKSLVLNVHNTDSNSRRSVVAAENLRPLVNACATFVSAFYTQHIHFSVPKNHIQTQCSGEKFLGDTRVCNQVQFNDYKVILAKIIKKKQTPSPPPHT